ncbi:MAG: hypothetical protein GX037_01700 [Trueperella sp.]|nr:hypothetical protein [Trueperella sp.]
MELRDLPRWLAAAAVFAVVLGAGLGLLRTPTDWLTFAQTRVDARNAALTAGSWDSLATLTAPDSPARRADEELWTWLIADGTHVEAIVTEVLSVEVADRRGPVLEVVSVQVGAHVSSNDLDNAGEPMCRRWHLLDGLLVDIRPCPAE